MHSYVVSIGQHTGKQKLLYEYGGLPILNIHNSGSGLESTPSPQRINPWAPFQLRKVRVAIVPGHHLFVDFSISSLVLVVWSATLIYRTPIERGRPYP